MEETKDIVIIMPLFNEGSTIKKTLEIWIDVLETLKLNYRIEIYNDGSNDNSEQRIEEITDENSNVFLYNCEHKGFSHTLFFAYKNSYDAEYVFHADSDTDINPNEFKKIWNERYKADLIIGYRQNRSQSKLRQIATKCSCLFISFLFNNFKITVKDMNTPFKLIKKTLLNDFLNTINETFPFPDLFLCAYCLEKKVNIEEIPILFSNSKKQGYLDKKIFLLKAISQTAYNIFIYKIKIINVLIKN
ncbi:glycosyltransferase [bacterium]|nr:glycosyltransferase [bacterium]